MGVYVCPYIVIYTVPGRYRRTPMRTALTAAVVLVVAANVMSSIQKVVAGQQQVETMTEIEYVEHLTNK